MISYHKKVRVCVLNYLSGNPERPLGISLSRAPDLLPIALGNSLLNKIRKSSLDHVGLRLIMTLLFFTRAFKGTSEPNLDSITAPCSKGPVVIDPIIINLF